LKSEEHFAGQRLGLAERDITRRKTAGFPVFVYAGTLLLLQNEMHGPYLRLKFEQNATIANFVTKLLKKTAECYKIVNECGCFFRMV
jgi:hypothetical protein